ncbi:MAG: hypothetical protein QOH29_1853 [Actinomycetota bacterium]|nr:hypothetical protein [Actinomycetota bacterium]
MGTLVAGLGGEIARLRSVVTQRWRAKGIRGYLLTMIVAALVVLMWILDHTAAQTVVAACCGERVDAPIGGALLRLPGSLVAPAPMLPVWGSLIQVVVAFGLAEAAVGARRTLVVASSAHIVATLAGRYFVWYAPAAFGVLPPSWRSALDTGPSAATIGLAAYLAVVLGCGRLGGLVALAVGVAFVARNDLAGREHMVAIVIGGAFAAVQLLVYRLSARGASDDISVLVPTASEHSRNAA